MRMTAVFPVRYLPGGDLLVVGNTGLAVCRQTLSILSVLTVATLMAVDYSASTHELKHKSTRMIPFPSKCLIVHLLLPVFSSPDPQGGSPVDCARHFRDS